MKIFINIASYRDPLLANTVKDAYDNAHYKDSLVFGIVDQSYGMETFDPGYFDFKKQIKYVLKQSLEEYISYMKLKLLMINLWILLIESFHIIYQLKIVKK